MKNSLIFANFVMLLLGLYVGNDIFIRMSVGGLMNLTILKVLEK